MRIQPFVALLSWALLQPLCASTIANPPQASTSDPAGSSQTQAQNQSTNSVPQNTPCAGQSTTFDSLSASFANGHLPASSAITGSWVLIGIWLHKTSHPELNCAGLMRGDLFEWVMNARGYSLSVDMVGTYHQDLAFKVRRRALTFSVDLEGDDSPSYRCRLSKAKTLVCFGDSYYNGLEFRRLPVDCSQVPPYPGPNIRVKTMECRPRKSK